MVEFEIVSVPCDHTPPPLEEPPVPAFPEMVEFVILTAPPLTSTPPPPFGVAAVLFETVELTRLNVPAKISMPPPKPTAELPVITQFDTVTGPPAERIPPPRPEFPVTFPPEMVKPEMPAATPVLMLKTRLVGLAAAVFRTVRTFAPGPRIV